MRAPSREDFDRWRDDSVTRWIFRAIETGATEAKDKWIHTSWENGVSNPALLSELRVRADAYNELRTATYDDWLAITDDEEPK